VVVVQLVTAHKALVVQVAVVLEPTPFRLEILEPQIQAQAAAVVVIKVIPLSAVMVVQALLSLDTQFKGI
jgi:hypothetical protein